MNKCYITLSYMYLIDNRALLKKSTTALSILVFKVYRYRVASAKPIPYWRVS